MIYLIGSLRNPKVPQLANALREKGFEVFDDWHGNGPTADDCWQEYEKNRNRNYRDALASPIPQHIFQIDKLHIDLADTVVLVLPAGKSGHLEFGYARGCAEIIKKYGFTFENNPIIKRCFILLDGEPERYDVMYNFADKVFVSWDELFEELKNGVKQG